jgi:hypothetical protein
MIEILICLLGLACGYVFGYDRGYHEAVRQVNESTRKKNNDRTEDVLRVD